VCAVGTGCRQPAKHEQGSSGQGIRVSLPSGWRVATPKEGDSALWVGPQGRAVLRVTKQTLPQPLPSPAQLEETLSQALSGIRTTRLNTHQDAAHVAIHLRLEQGQERDVVLGLANTPRAPLGCSTTLTDPETATVAFRLCTSLGDMRD